MLRFPAEWEPQSAVLIAWPHAGTDWAPRLDEVEATYVALVAAIGGWLSLFAWRQFTKLLSCAQALAEQAVCGECRTYDKFDVIEAYDSRQALTGRALVVRCRKCQHKWQMG